MHCRPDLPNGCPRCCTLPSPVCCELCNPQDFETLAHISIEKHRPQRSRSRINSTQHITPVEIQLRNALDEFRTTETEWKYGRANLINIGPSLVLPDAVLSRLIDCARVHKLSSTADIARETWWVGSEEYGEAIL